MECVIELQYNHKHDGITEDRSMNKNAIKKFAIEARKKLIASVSDRAGMLGITAEGCSEPISKGIDFEVYKTVAGTEVTLGRSQCEQRRKLKEQIEARGFEAVVEEVAYTWFNRICAIRFMEVNDYLPTRVRVLSSEKEGKNEPDIVTQAPDVDLDFTDKEREYILDCKMNNKLDELFKMLFIKQCNKLSEILPELFEATEDYTEMLLNISYTNKDDIINMLVNQETGIPEADFNVSTIGEDGQPTGQVEIIGWLYQYYNTELKDDIFAQLKKNVKISKERIPAATQLFTPDWIVRYMVENSVGRLWIEHLRAVDPNVNEKETAEKFGWKYYLPEAEQEADVNVKLAEIRTSYKDLKPEDITCIDPCMGSGHILVAMFDVLMDIYKSAGYSERDAAFEIVEHNIHGLDIDKRAYQLSYFAVMMKGRGYNRRFLSGKQNDAGERITVQPQVYVIEESNGMNRAQLKYFGVGLNEIERNDALNQVNGLLDELRDATEYGSILSIENYNWVLLRKYVSKTMTIDQMNFDTYRLDETQKKLLYLVKIGQVMEQKYDAVVTNPPYMGSDAMGMLLSGYVKKCYPVCKADMYAVFIERCSQMLKQTGLQAMITMHSWMFLSSFEKFREHLVNDRTFLNMCHLGARGFEEINGEVVQTVSWVMRNGYSNYNATYVRLVDATSQYAKEQMFLNKQNRNIANQKDYIIIPGAPIAYWVSDRFKRLFEDGEEITKFVSSRDGLTTGNNDLFIKYFWEISNKNIQFGSTTTEEFWEASKKYAPLIKGGLYRKWYGNNWFVITYDLEGYNKLSNCGNKLPSREIYFLPYITWNRISTRMAFRYCEAGYLFESASLVAFSQHKDNLMYALAFANSIVANSEMQLINPTTNMLSGYVDSLRVPRQSDYGHCIELAEQCVDMAKADWNSFETSWDFIRHPLVKGVFKQSNENTLAEKYVEASYMEWFAACDERFNHLKSNEEELNRIFIEIYGLQDELMPEVEDKDITVRKADLQRDIKNLLSYAVGCMFGRYSLDNEGIVFAGGEWDGSKYKTFVPDADNCILITDEEYFEDDIVGLFSDWIKKVYGEATLEENLDFIARALGNKGNTSRETIRNYFLNDFINFFIHTLCTTVTIPICISKNIIVFI